MNAERVVAMLQGAIDNELVRNLRAIENVRKNVREAGYVPTAAERAAMRRNFGIRRRRIARFTAELAAVTEQRRRTR